MRVWQLCYDLTLHMVLERKKEGGAAGGRGRGRQIEAGDGVEGRRHCCKYCRKLQRRLWKLLLPRRLWRLLQEQ